MRQLADKTGISARMIAYYETEEGSPPVQKIVPFVKALKVSADELLGIKEFKHPFDSEEHTALWRKLRRAALLSTRDQQGLIHYLNSMLDKRKIKK